MNITSTGFCPFSDTCSWNCCARYSSIVSGGRPYPGACCSTKSSSAHAVDCRILDRATMTNTVALMAMLSRHHPASDAVSTTGRPSSIAMVTRTTKPALLTKRPATYPSNVPDRRARVHGSSRCRTARFTSPTNTAVATAAAVLNARSRIPVIHHRAERHQPRGNSSRSLDPSLMLFPFSSIRAKDDAPGEDDCNGRPHQVRQPFTLARSVLRLLAPAPAKTTGRPRLRLRSLHALRSRIGNPTRTATKARNWSLPRRRR